MDTRNLESFCTVYGCGSINKAASMLHISSQGLSKVLAKLEAELGHSLFTRSSTGVVPTPYACDLYPRVLKACELLRPSQPGSYNDGRSVLRIPMGAVQMLDLMTAAVEEAGVEIIWETEFTRLITDGNGMVVGAWATDADGKDIAIKAKRGVVLCTGGFARCPQLLEDCMQGFSEVDSVSAHGATGAGHLAAMRLGAALHGCDRVDAPEGYTPDGAAWTMLFLFGCISTDLSGNRISDEGNYGSNARTRTILERAKSEEGNEAHQSWLIIDQAIYDRSCEYGLTSMEGLVDSTISYLVKGETIEELAEKIGAPNLPQTLEKYNEDMRNGKDTVFGRKWIYQAGSGDPFPIDQPPFYAYPSTPRIVATPYTGFMVNGHCQLLDHFNEPIGGDRLFAAGEIVTRATGGNHYLMGASLGAGVVLGMVCGDELAALENWE